MIKSISLRNHDLHKRVSSYFSKKLAVQSVGGYCMLFIVISSFILCYCAHTIPIQFFLQKLKRNQQVVFNMYFAYSLMYYFSTLFSQLFNDDNEKNITRTKQQITQGRSYGAASLSNLLLQLLRQEVFYILIDVRRGIRDCTHLSPSNHLVRELCT